MIEASTERSEETLLACEEGKRKKKKKKKRILAEGSQRVFGNVEQLPVKA